MADIKVLEEKISKAEVKVEKCKGTIERHHKQLDKKIQAVVKAVGLDLTGKSKEEIDELREPYRSTDHSWTIYEVISKLDDIKGARKKLAEAEKILENWQEKLSLEKEKERFLSDNAPQVIKEFLEQWKRMAYKWHVKRYDAFQEYKAKLDKEEEEARKKVGVEERMMPTKSQRRQLEEMEMDWQSIRAKKAQFAGSAVLYMDSIYDEEERLAWLEKTLEQDKKHKMLDLINRINSVVGAITDATGLRISEVGNLNGIITGEKAKAKVETIGAGGYAIQCFHFRTLVHKIK